MSDQYTERLKKNLEQAKQMVPSVLNFKKTTEEMMADFVSDENIPKEATDKVKASAKHMAQALKDKDLKSLYAIINANTAH